MNYPPRLLALPTLAMAGLLAAGAAAAQTANPPAGASTSPAAVSASANPRTAAAPVAGANSFTEGQARARIEEKGFGNVNSLKKDEKGVWRASAMKDGKPVTVAVDYQGNVVAN